MASSGNSTGPSRPTRYMTDTDDDSDSFFANIPTEVPISLDLGQGASISMGYSTSGPGPVNMTNQQDMNVYLAGQSKPPSPWPTNGGNTLIFVDTPPGASSEMHRTQSLDYTIQILGEVELSLSNGDMKVIRPGDVVVQRGTLHKWRNTSDTQWSRFVGICSGAEPIVSKNKGALPVVM